MCLLVVVQFSAHGSVVCDAGSALWLRAMGWVGGWEGSGAGPPCCVRWSVLLQGCLKLSWQGKQEVCVPSHWGCVTRAPSKMSVTA